MQHDLATQPVLSTWDRLTDYLMAAMGQELQPHLSAQLHVGLDQHLLRMLEPELQRLFQLALVTDQRHSERVVGVHRFHDDRQVQRWPCAWP